MDCWEYMTKHAYPIPVQNVSYICCEIKVTESEEQIRSYINFFQSLKLHYYSKQSKVHSCHGSKRRVSTWKYTSSNSNDRLNLHFCSHNIIHNIVFFDKCLILNIMLCLALNITHDM